MYRLVDDTCPPYKRLRAVLYNPDSMRASLYANVIGNLRDGECVIKGKGNNHDDVRFYGERFHNFTPNRELGYRVELRIPRDQTCDDQIAWLGTNIKDVWSILTWPFVLDRDQTIFSLDQKPSDDYVMFFMFARMADAYLFKIRFSEQMYIPHEPSRSFEQE